MIIKYKGREYELPNDIESLKLIADEKVIAFRKYPPPVYNVCCIAMVKRFMQKFPNSFNRKPKVIMDFYKTMFNQIAEFCIRDAEGYLLSDELGIIIVGKYRHTRKHLINNVTKERIIPLVNGEFLLRAYWIKPATKDFKPLLLYKYSRNTELLRNASRLFHNGKMNYMEIGDRHRLAQELMQMSLIKHNLK